jgi:3-oxoacyl-[acyl-carrier-protein] synthase-3
MSKGVKVAGVGYYVPEKVLDNKYFEKIVDTSDEWIMTRTGIKERRMAAPEQATSDLSIIASTNALKDAGMNVDDIDFIVHHSVTPDMMYPGTSCIVQNAMGIKNAGTMETIAGCTGFIYSLSVAYAYIKAGLYKNILVVAGDCLTRVTNYEDRGTCVLFGDGAGAFILTASDEEDNFKSFYLDGDGAYSDFITQPSSGSRMPPTHERIDKGLHYLQMAGQNTFKLAVTAMTNSAKKVIQDAGMSPDDIDWIIPHQANIRIMDAVAKRLKVSTDRVVKTIEKYGNTSATTIPIAFGDYKENGIIKRGDNILMVAFGAGATWGATLFQY